MDLLKKRLDIARLVAEELTGTIDEKNRIVLARWLDEDERHRKEYTNILESLKTGNEVWKDQERGRQLMESRWRAVKSHTVRKTGRWITWSKYAAVVLLFVSIGIFWLVNEEKQQEVLREVLKKKLTVADTERLIKKEPKPKKKKASADVKKTISRNVKIALNTLQQAIGMIEKTGTSLQQETEDLEDEYVITIRIHK
mgnify:FL=1